MSQDNKMTEWMKLERLDDNDLPLPRYETEFSAGVDFAACLTRLCKHIPPGKTHKEAEPFICGDPIFNTKPRNKWFQRVDTSELDSISARRCKYNDGDNVIFLVAQPTLIIEPYETIMIPLGFKTEFGKSYTLNIHVRSSLGLSGLILANGTGIVDPDYRGELFAVIHNRNHEKSIVIEHGQRIVQGVLLQFCQAIITEEKVDMTERGDGGFGSTGQTVDFNNGSDASHHTRENVKTAQEIITKARWEEARGPRSKHVTDEVEMDVKSTSETEACPPSG